MNFNTPQEKDAYERAPTIPSIPPTTERSSGSGSSVSQQNGKTRSSIGSVLGVSVLSVALGVGGTYGLYKYSGLFNTDEAGKSVKAMPSTSLSAQEPEVSAPEKVESNADLAAILKIYGIAAGADDFDKLAVRNKSFEALQLIPDQNQDADTGKGNKKLRYKWGSMVPAQITAFKDEEVIVVTLLKSSGAVPLLDYRGIRPTAVHSDEKNPLLTYHYYRCGENAAVGSIVIKDVKNPAKNTMLYGLQMPKCKPKEDPNMPQ